MATKTPKSLTTCPACLKPHPLGDFRRLSNAPLLYSDFCKDCEAEHGAFQLYKDDRLASEMTLEARAFVLAQEEAAEDAEKREQKEGKALQKELARRELMRRRFIYYVTQFRPDYLAGWVHQDICRRLERFMRQVECKKSPRLMLFVPPRHGKSTLVSDELPSWVLGHHPEWEIIAAAYAVSLPVGFSRRIRDRLDDKAYQAVFSKTKVRPDSRGVEEWLTTAGGRFRAAGVEGGITGTGCNCLPGDMLVSSPHGAVPIADIEVGDLVFAYNHIARKIEARRTQAVSARTADGYYRFTTAAGRVVKATAEHPIFTGSRYVRADSVATGDRLLCEVREGVSEAGVRDKQGAETAQESAAVLLCEVPPRRPTRTLRAIFRALYRLRRKYWPSPPECAGLLLSGVSESRSIRTEANTTYGNSYDVADSCMPRVSGGIYGASESDLLRKDMRRPRAFAAYVEGRQPSIPGRGEPTAAAAAFGQGVSRGAPLDSGARRQPVRGMQDVETAAGSPYQHEVVRQQVVQPRDDVRGLPHAAARRRPGETEADVVAVVEFVREPTEVFDIQVEGLHNFFAGGVNVLNCLIIDDPIKDYQEAQSDTVRENAYNWYTTTARTRLAPGGGVIVCQTRWHDADLAGRLLTDREALIEAGVPEDEIDQWEVVSYPALAEADEYLFPNGSIEVGPAEIPEDARLLRREGEALHPERYSAKALRTIRNTMPPVQWNALYQQNPVPVDGEYFTSEMFRYYTVLPGSAEEYAWFAAWDLAIGLKAQNDYTVGIVGALHQDGSLYVTDMIRGRLSTYPIVESMVKLGAKWDLLQVQGIEDGQIKKTLMPLLEKEMQKARSKFSFDEELKPVTDKLLRARPLQQRMQMGQVYFPAGQPWAMKIQQEMLRFPNGVHDDMVDGMAWLARMALRITPPILRTHHHRRARTPWRKELHKYTRKAADSGFMTA